MAEPFKNLLNAGVVQAMGHHLQKASPGFERARFEAVALDGLDTLELKARAHRLADALAATLPSRFDDAATVLEAALGPAGIGDDLGSLRTSEHGLAGWAVWPMTEYVARHGQADAPRALAALHAMTQRFSAEWAIRPFILNHPGLSFETLARWAGDDSAHVRRLVSEGSRPRLPWGMVLKPLTLDPSPTLPLLARLQDDPSEYVRRSVANHLNDIAKDHPGIVLQWLQQHLPDAPAPRVRLLRHASRSLLKQGDAAVLAAWGLGAAMKGHASLALSPARAAIGGEVTLDVQLQSTATTAQRLLVDYAVHHVKANGSTSAKVFKGWTVPLAAGEHRSLVKRHSLKLITTRRYHPGLHRVVLLVNGAELADARFELLG
jgi:3-methyladenine DNA glycosylase AlkC